MQTPQDGGGIKLLFLNRIFINNLTRESSDDNVSRQNDM